MLSRASHAGQNLASSVIMFMLFSSRDLSG
jgi:hypothetical protein